MLQLYPSSMFLMIEAWQKMYHSPWEVDQVVNIQSAANARGGHYANVAGRKTSIAAYSSDVPRLLMEFLYA